MSGKKYEFTSLEEIYDALDSDQIRRCFTDLSSAFSQAKIIEEMLVEMSDASGVHAKKPIGLKFPMTWIDDGLHNVKIRAMASDEELLRFESHQPEST